jgi:oligopeptide transport system permease protein
MLARKEATVIAAAGATPRPQGFWLLAWRRLLRNRLAIAGLGVLAIFTLLAVLAPLAAPYDPRAQDARNSFAPMSFGHLMGTDILGRDWFSRVVYGARLALSVSVFSQAVVVAIGMTLGLTAGYFGRFADSAIMRFTDLVYAFPVLLLVILMRSAFGGSVLTIILVIGFVTWVDLARLVRGQVLALREREFVEAARSLGATDREIMTRHLLPNLIGPVVVLVAFSAPRAVFIEASLSFIGIGVDPGTPSWGSMVQQGYQSIFSVPHLVIFPSAAIALLMLAFTFVGDGVRDALDPRYAPAHRAPEERELPIEAPAERELPKAA